VTAVASTDAVDRDNEIIEPDAFRGRLKRYMENPVVLAGHMHRLSDGRSSVVANVVEAKVTSKGLVVVMEFHCKTQLSREYWDLYKDKNQRAFSVGFIPIKGERQVVDGERVYTHKEVELIEISCVAVGSNREALSKSKQGKRDFVDSKRQGLDEDPDAVAAEFAEAFLGEWPEPWGEYEAACVRAMNMMLEKGGRSAALARDLLEVAGWSDLENEKEFVGSFGDSDNVGMEKFF
jgi:HK97 family phage prohead protease